MAPSRHLSFALAALCGMAFAPAAAATLTVDLGDAKDVAVVGAVDRWDQDGNPRRPIDPKAAIDSPFLDAQAVRETAGKWVFKDLKPGRYDLILLTEGKTRIEGFTFAPVKEFDPVIQPDARPEQDAADWILDDIRKSKQYENKVEPLHIAGGAKACRVLVMLLRDEPTSYTPGAGTLRHEIWQYSWNHGGWEKEKRTRVLDRILMPVGELRKWTWIWDPKLGGIEIKDASLAVAYKLPKRDDAKKLPGLYP